MPMVGMPHYNYLFLRLILSRVYALFYPQSLRCMKNFLYSQGFALNHRYVNLAWILTLCSISTVAKKRFPTLEHLVEIGES